MSDIANRFPPRSQRDKTPTVVKGIEQVKNPEITDLEGNLQPVDPFLAPIPAPQNEAKLETPRWAPVGENPEVPSQVGVAQLPLQSQPQNPQLIATENITITMAQEENPGMAPVVPVASIESMQPPTKVASMPVEPQPVPAGAEVLVYLRNVSKHYGKGETLVKALDDVSADIYAGQFTAIVGASGSGKSTMLHCLAGLDSITAGNINVAGQQINMLGDNQLTKFRRQYIGFIFQAFNLVPTLTALENITLPQKLAKQKTDQQWLDKVVNALGLADRLRHKPSELSGGQQQRVAVARALVARPALLVADEPTGNLDKSSSSEVLKMLRDAVDNLGQSVVMVTHDRRAAAIADRVLVVSDGKIVADMVNPSDEELAQVI